MINLLPPEVKSHYRYASRNARIKRWLVAAAFSIVGVGLIGAGGMIYLRQTSNSYTNQIAATTKTLDDENLTATSKQVNDISNSLKLSVQVLSKEVLFSKLLKQLATLTPSNASLSSLTINQADSALDIAANTTDYNAATQLQVNLASPGNKIFSKADIVSISCTNPSGAVTKYPCAVTIRALLAKDNPFLFINNKVAS